MLPYDLACTQRSRTEALRVCVQCGRRTVLLLPAKALREVTAFRANVEALYLPHVP